MFTLANSGDPDETPRFVMFLFRIHSACSLNFSLATPLIAHMRILTNLAQYMYLCILLSDSETSDMLHYQNLNVLARMRYCFLSPKTASPTMLKADPSYMHMDVQTGQ